MSEELDSNSIILHVGLHKTATTFLQSSIFPNFENVVFHNKKLVLSNIPVNNKHILVSNEGMLGCPYFTNGLDYFEQFKNSIDYLLNIFNRPKFIICFREPGSFINSCYKQYLHEGGTLDWNEYFSLEGDSIIKSHDFYFSKYVNYLSEKIPDKCLFMILKLLKKAQLL